MKSWMRAVSFAAGAMLIVAGVASDVRAQSGTSFNPPAVQAPQTWSGYAIPWSQVQCNNPSGCPPAFTHVFAVWTEQPIHYVRYNGQNTTHVECSTTWIGIGGLTGDSTQIKLGVYECIDINIPQVFYSPFYETGTNFVNLSGCVDPNNNPVACNITAIPGGEMDQIQASIQCVCSTDPTQPQKWALSMRVVYNNKTLWTWNIPASQLLSYQSSQASIEWIKEVGGFLDPNCSSPPCALPRFGIETLTQAQFNGLVLNTPFTVSTNGINLISTEGSSESCGVTTSNNISYTLQIGACSGAISLTDTHDYGHGTSAIAWRDTSGNVALWEMNGASVEVSSAVGSAPTAWSIVGQRDFNADGTADLLWHDSSGNVAIWFMNDASVIGSSGVGNANPSVWSVAGTGDFNGDGYGDILWRDSSGNVAMWMMNGASVAQSCGVGNAPPSWSIVGTGDFNGDGHTDILWHDTSGNVAIWFMSGCSVVQSSGIGNASPGVWSIAGTGDFNGDGKSDILWHDTSGNVAIWEMNGATILQSFGVGNANPSVWSIAQTGDYYGVGTSDILWRDTSGDVAVWEMNGATITQSAGVGTAPPVWSIQSAGAE